MDTATIAPPSEPTTPVTETPAPEPTTEAPVSIADHAEQYAPASREPANTGQFATRPADARPSHKAQSQRATPEDVTEINRLTKELRERERQLAEKDPDALKDSPRIRALKRQIAALDATLTPPAPAAAPAKPTPPTPAPKPSQAPAAFTDAEPKLDDFASSDDPYRDYMRALSRYDRKKEAWESSRQQFDADTQRQQQERMAREDAEMGAKIATFAERQRTFIASKPDYQQQIAKTQGLPNPTPLLHAAIIDDDKGPEIVYYLAQHPDVYTEMLLHSDGKPVTEQSVALLRRILNQRVQVASTGSTAAAPAYIPPKPPNPVRTGPTRTTDEPPGEGASIADHARYYHPSKRR